MALVLVVGFSPIVFARITNPAGINTSATNNWTGLQTFTNASTSLFSVTKLAYFGGTATSTFDSTGALTLITPLLGASGGTGVANTGKTITLGGNLTTSGANAVTFTTGGATNVTLPTSGTLAALSGANSWSALQSFTGNASSSQSSVFGKFYAGGTATTTISSTGALTIGNVTGSTQCLHVDTNGLVTGTGSDCAGSGPTVASKDATSASTNSTSYVVLRTVPITASALSSTGMLQLNAMVHGTGGNNQKNWKISIGNGAATTTIITTNAGAQNTNDQVVFRCVTQALASASSQITECQASSAASISSGSSGSSGVTSVDTTAKWYYSIEADVVSASDTANYKGSQAIIY